MASTMLLFPEPLGPVMAVNPGSRGMTALLKDLKFSREMEAMCIVTTWNYEVKEERADLVPTRGEIGDLGGDPSAGSPTDTLLRLTPPRRAEVRRPPAPGGARAASPRPDSDGLTGGVCKGQGRIHRGMLTRDYYGIHLHEGELQPSIRTTGGFRDQLPLSGSPHPLSRPL